MSSHRRLVFAAVIVLHDRSNAATFMRTTPGSGRVWFEFFPESGGYRIVARKLGFLQTMRLLRVAAGDTTTLALAISRLPTQLDTVRADARARPDDDHIDAAMIARIQHHDVKDAYDTPYGQSIVTAAATLGIPGTSVGPLTVPAPHAALDDILALIRPQNIASIDYRNCWDNSIPDRGMRNASFITLSPGIDFDDRHGSYPHDSIPGH